PKLRSTLAAFAVVVLAFGFGVPLLQRPAAADQTALETKDDGKKMTPQEELAAQYAGRPWAACPPIVTPHYNIHCNSTEENSRRYADVMEALYKAYDKVFPEKYFPRRRPPGKTRNDVYIHANHQQFMDWTGSPPGVGGFFIPHPKFRTVTAYHGSFGTSGSTEEVLAHEGTHQFQAMIFPQMMAVPTWTIEGMAVYFGDGSEIDRNEVTINIIPRDRLIGLQAAIEDGTYAPLQTLLRLPHAAFTGFHYGHGWGIFYWGLYGDKSKPKAWSDGRGHEVMNDWLLYCKDIQAPDLEGHARYFNDLLVEHTGKSLDNWESDYKDWILELKTDPIISKKGSGYVSEKLGFEIGKPSGWKKLKDAKLYRNEAIAFSTGNKNRRISTIAMGNWQHAPLGNDVANRIINGYFRTDEWKKDLATGERSGMEAIDGVFTATRVQQDVNTGQDTSDNAGEKVTVRVVVYATYDKIYANILESTAENFAKDDILFEKYLSKFNITI
ncbi:MAG: hypothetical protein AAF488_14010, partial [Planctomycetota bacterium]